MKIPGSTSVGIKVRERNSTSTIVVITDTPSRVTTVEMFVMTAGITTGTMTGALSHAIITAIVVMIIERIRAKPRFAGILDTSTTRANQ